ncbi:putative phenylalanine aminotransferase [Paractinoplanes deccanensis]|uniref:Histidinol-phosphate aminotransferase n=1 Tax=Paractinoplanes deccanensis TaxID=113561 RepID=A0ABQ3XZ72_9ACTN|nr:putative phenylalanine aminotransferase [Actinoplanes deccanensis]
MTTASAPAPRALEHVEALPRYVTAAPAPAPDAVLLASNESPFDPLPSVRQAVIDGSARLHRYPEMHSGQLRAELGTRLGVRPERIVVGTGSVGVLQQIFTAFARAGDEIVFPWRSFEAYPILAGACGATAVAVPLDAAGGIDLAATRSAIGPATKIVLLCLPNNPTGTMPAREAIAEFVAAVPPHVLVVLDEAYLEFTGAGDETIGLLARHANLVLVRTFSKAYGLAGLRVGYAVAPADVADALRRVFLPFGVTALAQLAALASLRAGDELAARVAAVVAERERVHRLLREHGWRVPRSYANFVWLADPGRAAPIGDRLRESGVLTRVFPGEGVRLTIGTPEMNDRALAALSGVRPR